MSFIKLKINEPSNDACYNGAPPHGRIPITFRGEVQEMPPDAEGAALYYRWYSSLYGGEEDHYAINDNAQTGAEIPFSWEAGLGSHAVTFAATDRPGETVADFEAVTHMGLAGGAEGEAPCRIHVFSALILSPEPGTAWDNGDVMDLAAVAPFAWARPADDDPALWIPNEGYHQYNRLQYRWLISPTDPASGQVPVELKPSLQQLEYVPPEDEQDPPRVQYAWNVSALSGAYAVRLFVEDKLGWYGGSEASINITIA